MEQSGSVSLKSIPNRPSFDVDAFADTHDLNAVASNMFKTENK